MGDSITLPLQLGSGAEREVQTLFADAWRKLTSIHLRNNAVFSSLAADVPMTIQCIAGAGALQIQDKNYPLTTGALVPVDAGMAYRLSARPEITLLVTLFYQPQSKPASAEETAHRQRLEAALHEAEDRYRALVENARDVIFTLTPDGVFTSLNAVFKEATGWAPEEWIGRSFLSLLYADDAPLALDLWQRTLQGESPPMFELRLSPKSGETLFAEMLVTPRLQDGKVVSVLGIARNVTERKREAEVRHRAEMAESARRALENEIAERQRVEDRLRYRLAIEEALVRATRLFTVTAEPDLKQVLGILGEAVGANRAYIFLVDAEGNTVSNTDEWCDQTTESWRSRLQALDPNDFPWLRERLEKGEPVVVFDMASLPEEAKNEKALSAMQQVCSMLAVPIRSRKGHTIGFLGFETVSRPHSWSDEDMRLLSVVSEVIASYLARKRAEDALRAAEQDYRAIFENAVEGIYRSSLDGHQLRANPALVKLNGYASEEELLASVNDIATEWYVERQRRDEFKRALEAYGTVTEFESEIFRHKTRERIWISETARLVRDAQGNPLYYEGTVQDITARKRAEASLREREARLSAIFRAVSDVIVTLDMNNTLLDANRALERLLGYKPEEINGQPLHFIVTPESAALAQERTVRALQGESLLALVEVVGVHKNGKRIPLEASASFLYEHGKPVGQVGVLRDITLKKELEQQRADFLAMLTHDIKNPIHVILGCTELLLEERLDSGQQNLLRRLRGNALTVHSLVTNYLEFSKIESGHLSLLWQPVAINSLLRDVGQQYETEAARRSLTLQFELQEELPVIQGDPLALERVFANLLHNALKFTPKFGRISIRSALHGEVLAVMIADSGPGIAHKDLLSLFERYRQAEQGRTTDGAGLGLFIVKALVEAHGGRVEVESAPGQGSCFSVFLPMTFLSFRSPL